MITYPSTHGVFEATVTEVCDIVHQHGGQVYLDGANLNALLGVAKPGEFGSRRLASQSPQDLHHPARRWWTRRRADRGARRILSRSSRAILWFTTRTGPRDGVGAVAAAPWGSAGILPIPWAYIAMMGARRARRRRPRWRSSPPTTSPSVSTGTTRCCTRDTTAWSPTSASSMCGRSSHDVGVTVDDFAKRLIDYGFHAPTMSFPVAGTLMIEPTESEPKAELDRFCDAMIAIKARGRRHRGRRHAAR